MQIYFILRSVFTTFALRKHQYLMKRILDILHKCLIVRELLPPPIAVCSIDKHSYVFNFFTLSRMGFAHRGRVFMCLCVLLTSFFFVSCEHYDDVSHIMMEAYYEESQGLDQVPLDSIRRFSAKVDEWINVHPEARKEEIYEKIQLNIHTAMVRIRVELDDSWGGDKYITFDFNDSNNVNLNDDHEE